MMRPFLALDTIKEYRENERFREKKGRE